MKKKADVLLSKGFKKHFITRDKSGLRLRHNIEFKSKSYAKVLSLEDIKWSFFLLALIFLIVIENLHKKCCLKINLIFANRLLQ
jgi:hypothetical protein